MRAFLLILLLLPACPVRPDDDDATADDDDNDDDAADDDDDTPDYDPSQLPSGPDPARSPLFVTVNEVIDGDTIEVARGNQYQRVRVLSIDTPELNLGEPWGPDCWATEARTRTRELLPTGTPVWLTFDGELTDDFGRFLSYVFVGESPEDPAFADSINHLLVAEGHARTFFFPNNQTFRDELEAAEDAARAQGLGMWSCD